LKAAKNDFESYAYEMKANIDSYGPLEKYVDEETRKSFLQKINEAVDWIYGDGQTAPREEFKKRLDEFRKIG